jgi:uncharacterized cupredoxin-like copper-binding protein
MRKPLSILAFILASQIPAAALVAQAGGPETIPVQLSSFKFAPSELTLQRGHSYRLHLVNASGGGHDFSAPAFFAASTIAPADRGKVAGGKVRLSGKQAVDITLTPERAGSYPLTCTHFMHSGFGMKGRITVQ